MASLREGMPRSTSSVEEDLIGSATSAVEIIHSLAKRGCSDLSSSIDLSACSDFPCAGGGFCDVYQGVLHNGTRIAIKSLRVYVRPEAVQDSNGRKILERAARELYHWSKLQHRNVLPLLGLAMFRGQISMISKWMESGSLALFLRLHPDANRSTICADICEGLCYIHANEVVHGGLRGANVMVSSNGTAMISDFGNSQLKDLTLRFSNLTKSSLSIRWAAPELLLEDSGGPPVSKEADVYAYGMTVLEVLTGKVPYEGISDNRVLMLVAAKQQIPARPQVNMPDDVWDLLNSCWNRNPSKRLNIAGVRDCLQALFWFPSNSQLINGATTVEEIVHSLTKRGCLDLTSFISMRTCSEFPRAGGGYCDVYGGALRDGTRIAIRTLRIYDGPEGERDGNRRKILKRAARELYQWSKLQHSNVLPLLGLAVFRGQISMISKWMENGSLDAFLRSNPDANRPIICADICEGLCYLHANGAVHGDLKAANVMISSNGTAMIADFGNTRLKNLTLRFSATVKTGLSVRWAAPELLLKDSGPPVSKEADVYAYGMTVLEVLTGKVPYEGVNSDHRILILVAVKKQIPNRPEANMPDDVWDLLKSCWHRKPSKRPKIAGVKDYLQALSWFPSDPRLTKGAVPDHTRPKHAGSVEGPKQVGGSATRMGENPLIIGGSSPIGEEPSRNGTDTASKGGPYNYATATPVTPVNEQPTRSMPSPGLWNDSGSPERRANAGDAAMSAHARALEQARKLTAGEDGDEEEEEETQRYVRSKFGDQSGQSYSDGKEEESEEEETNEEETESGSEETESSASDRQQRHPPSGSQPDVYYPNPDCDNQSGTTSAPAITINSPSNGSDGSSVVTRITDGDRFVEPSEFGMESLENEPLDYDEFPSLDPPNHYAYGSPSPSAGHYNGFPAPYDHVPNSRWSRSPGMGLQPPGPPDFTGFDGELDSLKYEPTNNVPARSNPSRASGRGSSNGLSRSGTARPAPPPAPIIIIPKSSSQPSTQRTANSGLASPPTADKSPGPSRRGAPGSGFAARMGAGRSVRISGLGWGFGRSPSFVPAPAPEPALALVTHPSSQHLGAKEREAEKARERELEKSRQRELKRNTEQELEKAKEREREKAEHRQPAPTVPTASKPKPSLLPRLSRGSSLAKQIGSSPVSDNRQTTPPVRPIVPPPLRIVHPPAPIVESPVRNVEVRTKSRSNTVATPITPIVPQPRGHDQIRSKKTAPVIEIKSTHKPSSVPPPMPEPEPESEPAPAPAPPLVIPIARAPSRVPPRASAQPASRIPIRVHTISGSRPETSRVRNILGPTPQVSMAEVGSSRRPDVISSQPLPQQSKKFPLTPPTSRFTERNTNKIGAQVKGSQALRDQQDLETQRQRDTTHKK